jgi:antitoxin ParD1/3/4
LVTLKKKLIMNRNTSISLGSYFDKFVQGRISAGRFNNASEVIRAGLRLLEDEENKIIVLREAIKEGMESGIAENFNPDRHLRMMKAKKNG